MSAVPHQLRCVECGRTYDPDPDRYLCDGQVGEPTPGGPRRGVLEVVRDELPGAWPEGPVTDPRWASAFLPVGVSHLPPLPAGGTADAGTTNLAARVRLAVTATGEATRFSALVTEYRKAPEVTRKRLFLETMEEVLPEVDKVVIEPGATQVMPLLPLDRRGRVSP